MGMITISGKSAVLNPEVSSQIAEFERQVKAIEAKEKELKKAILDEMDEKGILKIETPELLINYIASTDRESFDSKRFRSLHPALYDEFITISPVKASIRIKVR